MLRIISIFVLFIFLSEENVFAQQRTTGPKAKFQGINKVKKEVSVLVYTNHDHKAIKGPEAKNSFLHDDLCPKEWVKISARRNLKGPKAKNTRPEDDDYWISDEKDI